MLQPSVAGESSRRCGLGGRDLVTLFPVSQSNTNQSRPVICKLMYLEEGSQYVPLNVQLPRDWLRDVSWRKHGLTSVVGKIGLKMV